MIEDETVARLAETERISGGVSSYEKHSPSSRTTFACPQEYQPQGLGPLLLTKIPACSPPNVQRCVIRVPPLMSLKVQTNRHTARERGNSITALPTWASTIVHATRPYLFVLVDPRVPAVNGPSISTDSTSGANVQLRMSV